MAIETGGFPVQVMPRFAPVDPALLVFNPQNVVQGASGVLGISQQIEQLKSLRQQTEELAKSEQARLKLAKAKSELAQFEAEIAGQTQSGKIGVIKAQQAADIATIPALAKFQTAQADLGTQKIGAEGSMLPDLTLLQKTKLAGELSRQPTVERTLGAQADTGEAQAVAANVAANADLDNVFDKVYVAKRGLELAKKNADYALEDFQDGKILAKDYEKAKIAHEAASANLANANAEFARAKENIEGLKITAKQQASTQYLREYNAALQTVRDTSAEQYRLLRSPVPNPKNPSGAPVNLSEIVSLAFEEQPDGSLKPKTRFWKETKLDPLTKRTLQQLQDVTNQLEEATAQRKILWKKVQSTSSVSSPTPAAPKVGEVVNGYSFKGGNPNDQNNWEKSEE